VQKFHGRGGDDKNDKGETASDVHGVSGKTGGTFITIQRGEGKGNLSEEVKDDDSCLASYVTDERQGPLHILGTLLLIRGERTGGRGKKL